jgi:hypothetical protein
MALNESNGRGGRANFDVAHAAKVDLDARACRQHSRFKAWHCI